MNYSSTTNGTPRTAPSSPFFHPSTPRVVVVQQTTPRGTRRTVPVKEEVTEHKSSILGCTANLMNSIVGAGIVGIPFAIKQAGFCAGIVLIFVVAILTETSLRWLINTAKHVHVGSYETVAEAAFGVKGFRFVALAMFVNACGAMVTYLVVIKDTFATLLLGSGNDGIIVEQKRAVLFLVSLCILVPLSSQRDVADLAKTSRLSVLIDAILVSLVAYNAPIRESLDEIGGPLALFDDVIHYDTIFIGLGVLSFAFVCQHASFIVAGSLERPTAARWSIVTGISLSLCAALALTCGITGYAGYLDLTDGNILNNLGDGISASLARGLLGTAILFVYPIESFVARHVCIAVLFIGKRAHDGDSDASILNRRDRRIGLTFLLYLLTVLPAAFVEDMGTVLAFSGAIGGSLLAYIGPGMVFLGIHGSRFLDLISESCLGCMLKGEHRPAGASNDSTDVAASMVETTPLVANRLTEKGSLSETKDEDSPYEPFYVLKAVVWYIFGFPIWCAIAREGRKGLTHHVHDMTLQSPHPIRIGNVEYSRVLLSEIEQSINVASWPPQHHVAYSPLPGSVVNPLNKSPSYNNVPTIISGNMSLGPVGNGQSINAQIGKDLLRKQQQQNLDVESDPQEVLPTGLNFLLAIFFILFGMLAMVVGILCLFLQEDKKR